MKYAFMTFSMPQSTLDEALAFAKKHGFDGIEPRAEDNHRHGIEYSATPALRAEIKGKSEDAGVSIACIATSCAFADPAHNPQTLDNSRKAIDLAGDVGCNVIRVFGGNYPETISREQAFDNVVQALSSLSEHAKSRGVYVCMETHDSWRNPNAVADIMKQVNHPNIGVNWDYMHCVFDGFTDVSDSYNLLQPWIKHVHFHDGVLDNGIKFLPAGEGAVDNQTAVRLLKTAGYDGFLSGEWFGWNNPEMELPRELNAMKRWENS